MYEAIEGHKHPQRRNVNQYNVADKAINKLMRAVLEVVPQYTVLRQKLFQVNYHSTLSGQAMVTLVYHKKLGGMQQEWQAAAARLRYACCSSHVDCTCSMRSQQKIGMVA
jgi:tRNA (uracil-5-)-methyltransferase